jgi:hypothetical protein
VRACSAGADGFREHRREPVVARVSDRARRHPRRLGELLGAEEMDTLEALLRRLRGALWPRI